MFGYFQILVFEFSTADRSALNPQNSKRSAMHTEAPHFYLQAQSGFLSLYAPISANKRGEKQWQSLTE